METNFNDAPKDLINFLNYLHTVKNYTDNTIVAYYKDIMIFFRFIKQYKKIEVDVMQFNIFIYSSIEEKDILAFLVYLNFAKNNKPNTRQRRLVSIRLFYKWLYSTNNPPIQGLKNPAMDIHSIEPLIRMPKHLNLEQAEQIQNIFTIKNSKLPLRNNTIIRFLLNTGVRASELININISDVNIIDKTVIIHGKGGKERVVFINKKTMQELEKYLSERYRKEKTIQNNSALFVSYNSKRIGIDGVENICKNAYKLMGIGDMNYTTHTLRHTFATIIYRYTKQDINLIKTLLGHSTIKSTNVYLHTYNKEIIEAVNRNPLNIYNEKESNKKCA